MNPQKVKLLLLIWKVPSAIYQLFFGAVVAACSGQEQPMLNLKTLMFLGAGIVTCRGVDALLDMTIGSLVHVNTENDKTKGDTEIRRRLAEPGPVP